jgi:hypothetical protein
MTTVPWGATNPDEVARKQAIPLSTRNDVHMQVGDTLADADVDCDEGTVCRERPLDRRREQLDALEEGADGGGGEIIKRAIVPLRDDQTVASQQRTDIEEGQGGGIVEHNIGGGLASDDGAERARAFGPANRVGLVHGLRPRQSQHQLTEADPRSPARAR